MEFRNPIGVNRKKVEEVLRSGSEEEIQETLVAMALNEEDLEWAQEKCLECSLHSHWSVRAIAATCIGHLARIHRTLDLAKVLPRVTAMMADPMTRAYAQNAFDDIETFMPTQLADAKRLQTE